MSLRSNATDGPALVFEDVSVVRDGRLIWSEGHSRCRRADRRDHRL